MERAKLHPLTDILAITLLAVIYGADEWTDWYPQRRDWTGLHSFVCVESERTINGQTSIDRRYDISDLSGADARAMLGYVRGHGGIENQLHWPLDLTFREDTLRPRVGHSAENLSRIRRWALNLLRRDQTCKNGLKGKRLKACLKQDYLLRIISQGIQNAMALHPFRDDRARCCTPH